MYLLNTELRLYTNMNINLSRNDFDVVIKVLDVGPVFEDASKNS